ncbi:TonB-dependent receptor [Marinimicrobium sp. ABcell2]|uniref:TonB-dependent receptor n=1 Tax=Marinimicrobium sp. ABcell2 TaxID=3069751 RepID=UPI0027B5766F|nr:TonB-dependent receptor [Marinimicrobium sp. ABcell2]MDQ2075911.1 TonB-dependent receptor [Marinimicrobium sp. ABcell2]
MHAKRSLIDSFTPSVTSSKNSLTQPTFRRLLLPSLIASTIMATPVWAQGTRQSVVEEVLVTAQMREQDMQDVSVAVSAFSGEAIERMGFEEGLDITQQVPNMNFFAIFGEASSPSIALRGVSLVNFSDSWEAPVAIYVDDVYRGNPAGSAIQLFDLERVEVLRGPQGTLYGRNTTGGLVHYISRKPTDTLEAAASVSYGTFNEMIVEGMVSGPLSDGIRGRLALKSTTNDGWQTNTIGGQVIDGNTIPDDKLNETDNLGYRGQVEFDLGLDGLLRLSVHGSHADQTSVGFAHMGYLQEPVEGSPKCSVPDIQAGRCTSATFGGMEDTPGLTGMSQTDGRFGPKYVASGATGGLRTEIDTFGVSANLTWDFGGFQLTSITAYEELDKFLQDDGDATQVIWFDEQYTTESEQFTQEIRLNGANDRMTWVTGVYYYDDHRDMLTEAPTTADGLWHREAVQLDTESVALFGQVEYDLTSQLTAVIGARYTDESREFHQDNGPSFYEGLEEISITRDFSDSAFTGRLGLDWRPVPDTLIYASLSNGFKSGGFSASYNGSIEATLPVDSEDIVNFEVGLKTDLADGRVRLNAAAFTYEIKGYQAQVFLTVAEGSVITNAGDVRGMGAELEVTAQVTDNFELIAGVGLLDTEFDSEQMFIVAGDEYGLDGNELPSAPGLTYNFVARYYMGLANGSEVVFQGDYSWQDDHYLQLSNDPYAHHDAYGIGNAKISWHSPDQRYTVAAFANNIFDEEYYTYQNTLGPDWGYGVWGKPRTVGARFAWKY